MYCNLHCKCIAENGRNLSPSSLSVLLVLWQVPPLCPPLHFHYSVLQPLLSAHGLHHLFSLTWLPSSLSFSKPLHYVFPHHRWSLTHFIILFWTYRVELKWERIWVPREIWIKFWSSLLPGIGARHMELILLHDLRTRKMFKSLALPSYSVYHQNCSQRSGGGLNVTGSSSNFILTHQSCCWWSESHNDQIGFPSWNNIAIILPKLWNLYNTNNDSDKDEIWMCALILSAVLEPESWM